MIPLILTQLLIGFIALILLIVLSKRVICDHPKFAAFFFLVYFIDNLVITLTNHFHQLQFTPNRIWEGFLLWGWSGKMYSILIILVLLGITRFLSLEDVGLTVRQYQGSSASALAVIFLIALGSSALGMLCPKGGFDPGLLLYLAILPGFNEELVYRGILPASLDRFSPKVWVLASAKFGWSMIITTLVFGLLHGLWLDNHFELHLEIIWIRNALFSGFIFAWLRERTGSLIMPIIAHGVWDFFLFIPRMI